MLASSNAICWQVRKSSISTFSHNETNVFLAPAVMRNYNWQPLTKHPCRHWDHQTIHHTTLLELALPWRHRQILNPKVRNIQVHTIFKTSQVQIWSGWMWHRNSSISESLHNTTNVCLVASITQNYNWQPLTKHFRRQLSNHTIHPTTPLELERPWRPR